MTLVPNDRAAFVDSLTRSDAVIATAGHNLITEALYLRVPMFLLPFDHYEQRKPTRASSPMRPGVAALGSTR